MNTISDTPALDVELLKWLRGQGDRRLCLVMRDFPVHARRVFPDPATGREHRILEAVWSVVRSGWAYLDFQQPAATNWSLELTDLGRQIAEAGELNPYDTESYMKALKAKAPQISETVSQYAHQALVTFRNECHLASAVMLGVASEAAFLEMAAAFAKWLPGNEGMKFGELVASSRRDYIDKFREFRPRFQKYRAQMPGDAGDSLTMDTIADLLRIYRNDSGHPNGRQVSREEAYSNLRVFMSYMERLYKLKAFFERERCPQADGANAQ